MKIALRWFCLVSLVWAGWSAVGAEERTPTTTRPIATTPAGSATVAPNPARSTAVLSPPTVTAVTTTPLPAAAGTATIAFAPVAAPIAPPPTPPDIRLSHGTLTPTPEMWFYEQMRQDENNQELQMRRRAEAYAAERRARMTSRAWFGYSNSRPTAHVTPFMYYYSPAWSSNTANPFLWSGRGSAAMTFAAPRTVGVSGFGTW